MKITNVEKAEMGESEMIVVTVEEYPHAQPCFPADISAKDLESALKAWKTNQDAVDAINAARTAQPAPDIKIKTELVALIGKTLLEDDTK